MSNLFSLLLYAISTADIVAEFDGIAAKAEPSDAERILKYMIVNGYHPACTIPTLFCLNCYVSFFCEALLSLWCVRLKHM